MSRGMSKNLRVIYNDTCPICSREVDAYAKYSEEQGLNIEFDGLEQADLAAHGLNQTTAAQRFHVVQDGQLFVGLDAFVLLWREMPRFSMLARFVSLPVVRPLANWLYEWVAAPVLFLMHKRRIAKKEP